MYLIDISMDSQLRVFSFWIITIVYLGAVLDIYVFKKGIKILRGVIKHAI
jgi:hypothetical protein